MPSTLEKARTVKSAKRFCKISAYLKHAEKLNIYRIHNEEMHQSIRVENTWRNDRLGRMQIKSIEERRYHK